MAIPKFPPYEFPDRSGPQELGTPFRRVVLVGIVRPGDTAENEAENLHELHRLVETLEGTVVGEQCYRINRVHPHYFIGPGRADVVGGLCDENLADTVVFDALLSPTQIAHLEYETGSHVMDRKELILEIFSRRAQTAESKLQVEMAYLDYVHPRMSSEAKSQRRQRGGRGSAVDRGVGEKATALKSRAAAKRRAVLKKQLEKIEMQRQQRSRQRADQARVALVGYTNAGKSTLLTRLSGDEVYADDRLFATLDTTTRRVYMPNGRVALFTDTVGFIRRLPHELVASFRSTLNEALEAQVIVHVADCSSPDCRSQMEAVESTLREMGAEADQALLVLNKIDVVAPEALGDLQERYPQALFVSASTGAGIDALRAAVAELLRWPEQELKPCCSPS